ncbi:S8 family serine peptidase [Aliikangiella coralliicola]|uniref:S8 family serine peptidase n=1 Tax=Aliikangiella coralliicola TaxID=2592383 RepID=A0A545UE82_9GAMM|nr:S8 family serine peptidase [Aliikangiella coralliicola]TQV87735.1 S8 family serine peptidase [Aliikangiella coralliicola]
MKKGRMLITTVLSVILASMTGLAGANPSTGNSANSNQAVNPAPPLKEFTDRIIVKFKEGTAAAQNLADTRLLSETIGQSVKFVRITALESGVYQLGQRIELEQVYQLTDLIAQRADVSYAEPDAMMQAVLTPNDSRYNEQWHYFENNGGIRMPTAWDQATGQGAVVAVLDTGYRPHVDLNSNILAGYDMISDTFVSRDGDGRDSNAQDPGDWTNAGDCGSNNPPSDRSSSWHGTHVAGTVAAKTNNSIGVAGVAFNARIVPVRVLGRCGGYVSDISDGIIWAAGGSVSGVPANQNPANVINLSLGGGGACGSTYQNAINYATGQNTTVVISAGNSNANAANFRPANCNGVVTVAATNRSGGKAFYSNFGNVVEVAAPGGAMGPTANGVLSTLNTGTTTPGSDSYSFYQGTSMAAPHVAGVAALMYGLNANLTSAQVGTILQNTARSFPATCNQCGSGIVNATAAIAAVPGSSQLLSGKISLNHVWKTTAISGLSNPRVVMGIPSFAGSQPTTVRVRNVSASSFQSQIDEWNYLDGAHVTESIAYLAAQNGNSTFGSLDVKSGSVTLNHGWKTVNFGSTFSNVPVVVAQTATFNGPAAVTHRIRNVTSSSFQIRLQEEENADGIHANEQVHWIAIESGSTTSGGKKLTVGRTGNVVTHNWRTINFGSTTNPKVIAAMQTFDGGDAAALRHRNLTNSSVQVKVEEEQSKDSEVAHTTEVVGYIIIGN